MADTQVGVNLIGRDISATRALQRVGQQAHATSSAFEKFGKVAALAGVTMSGAFAAAKTIEFFRDSAKAAIEDEASVSRLAQTMKNLGLANQEAGVEKLVDNLQFQYGVADTELRPAMDRLLRSTRDVGQANAMLSLAMDIAANKHIALSTVTAGLGKALDGNTTALGRMGLGIDKATLKSGDMNKITGLLEERFKGSAAAAAETWQGKLSRLSVALDELKEAAGYGILDGFMQGIGGAGGGVDGLVASLRDLQPQMRQFGQSIGQIGGALVTVGGTLMTAYNATNQFLDAWSKWGPISQGIVGGISQVVNPLGWLADRVTTIKDAILTIGGDTSARDRLTGMADTASLTGPTLDQINARRGRGVNGIDPALANVIQIPKMKPFTFGNGTGAARVKAVADSISAEMQAALGQAQAKVNAFTNSQASGFGEVGMNVMTQLVAGIHLGGKSQKTGDAIRKQLQDGLAKVGDLVQQAREYGKGIAQGLMGQLDIGTAADDWQARQDAVTEALKAVVDARAKITAESTDAERANLAELQTVYQKAQEDAAKGGATIVDAFVQQAAKTREFAEKMQLLLAAGLNQTSWDQIAGMSAEKGIKIANALIDGNMAQNIARTNDAVGSVKTVSDQVGAQAIKTFKLAGIEMAIAMFESMEKVITGGGTRKKILEGMQSLKDEMNRIMAGSVSSGSSLASGGGSTPSDSSSMTSDSSSMTSDEIALMMWTQAAGLPAFADGGIVPATPGGRIVRVAEAGQAEAIIPLDRLGGSGGTTVVVNVTVQGSVASERDLTEAVRQGIGTGMRRRGLDPAVIGL